MQGMRLIGTTQAAALLGISKQRLSQLRKAGRFPKPDGYVDNRPGWKRRTLEQWQEKRAPASIP